METFNVKTFLGGERPKRSPEMSGLKAKRIHHLGPHVRLVQEDVGGIQETCEVLISVGQLRRGEVKAREACVR